MVAELWHMRNLRKQCVSILGALLSADPTNASVDSRELDHRKRFSADVP